MARTLVVSFAQPMVLGWAQGQHSLANRSQVGHNGPYQKNDSHTTSGGIVSAQAAHRMLQEMQFSVKHS